MNVPGTLQPQDLCPSCCLCLESSPEIATLLVLLTPSKVSCSAPTTVLKRNPEFPSWPGFPLYQSPLSCVHT